MESIRGFRGMAGPARALGACLGLLVLLIVAYGLAGELENLRLAGLGNVSVRDAATFVGLLMGLLSGGLLLGPILSGIRIRSREDRPAPDRRPVYGFTTILAIGIGSTLGSPLFLLIPLNVVEYAFVSVLSLACATALSVAMAKNNADSYRVLKANRLDAVGGPAFVRTATGAHSARYFISRTSMAVANTTLAAYCVLVFVVFVFGYVPSILAGLGLGGLPSFYVVAIITLLFAAWFLMNSVFERRFVRVIGFVQIGFTTVLVAILVSESYLLGSAGGWNVRNLFAWPASSPWTWIGATLVNTGYLYLLFFGFQEIQALDREARDRSAVPVLSRIWKGLVFEKSRYFAVAMVATVLIAAAVNLFYAVAVYAANPSPAGVAAAQIPALYVADSVLSGPHEALTALAFLLATFTTFVPAFLAATRHISSLGEDGFLPRNVARGGWLFVLASIVILAAAGEAFLVSITDYMVLVSLGIIALSAIWLRRNRRRLLERKDALALGVGVSCYVAAGALYVVTPAVAIFGSLAIAVAFLVYDLFDLGSLGARLFLAVTDVVAFVLLSAYPQTFAGTALPVLPGLGAASAGTDALRLVLLLGGGVLVASFATELLAQSLPHRREARPPRQES